MPQVDMAANKDESLRDVQRLRKELKGWERQFEKQNSRKPDKSDIVKDKELAQRYRLYSKMKMKLAKAGVQDSIGSGQSLNVTLQSKEDISGSNSSLSEQQQKKESSHKPAAASNNKSATLKAGNGSRFKSFVVADTDHPEPAASDVHEAELPGSPVAMDFDEAPAEILSKTDLAFQTNHPLLRKLSHVPTSEEYVVVDDLQKEDGAKSPTSKTERQFTELADVSPFSRVPDGFVLKCKVTRQSKGLFPEFTVINEINNSIILGARKRKKNRHSTYLISSDPKDLSKQGSHYLAKLKEDASGLGFVVQDARNYSKDAPKKGMKHIAAIIYNKEIAPHDMKIAIRPPAVSDDNEAEFTQNILEDLNNEEDKKVQIYRSKRPRRTADGKSFGLNFHGRVTMASIKNFQIADGERLIMQFGRTGDNSFSMDIYAPLTPVEAFSTALTIFEAYDTI